ncbi:GSCFA domain-containing protein [Butyricimonas virosa]|uniref:GSCFA domain-containing protein n=1 Tax=Butyricimonas virosa TaxID=544645 RepID=UPI00241C3BC0|nr:GSCFA domain-containing protein [Butyricimonas virosa]
MNLQTKITVAAPDFLIDYNSRLMMLGSCFAENMGSKFSYYKFDVDVNPCGIIYNPLSVANVLRLIVEGKQFEKSDLRQVGGKWVSLYHHGAFSSTDPDECLRRINDRLTKATGELRTLDLLVITWGTAWVYRYTRENIVVSNCHKIPSQEFERSRLSVEDIVKEYLVLIGRLREINPGLRILFTVSPIRHWKDGAHGNQLSKATLLLAIDRLREELQHVYYFPAYEIVLDELRDYRFYADDMLHMSGFTVDYIWERFLYSFISPEVLGLMNQIGRVNKGVAHRPFDPQSEEYQRLVKKMLAEIAMISRSYPMIDFSEEKRKLNEVIVG